MWKFLFALVVSAAVITTSVYLYRHRDELFRPDVQKVGGTLIAFAIEEGQPDETYFTSMRKRFDPRGRLGVVVRKGELDEIEILIPQGSAHDDTVDRVQRLAARPGNFGFVLIANRIVDEEVTKYAHATYAPGKSKARTTPPPLPIKALGGREFSVTISGSGPRRYRWVRIGDAVLESFLLDPASLAGVNLAQKPDVDRSLRTGSLLSPAGNPDSLFLVGQIPEVTDPVYFLLVGDDSDIQALTTKQIRSAELSQEGRSINTIRLQMDPEGATQLSTMQNQRGYLPSALPRSMIRSFSGPSFALVIDDRIVTLANLELVRRLEANMTLGSSGEDVEDLVCLLRGPLPGVRLKAEPTRVEALEPRR